MIWVSPLVIIIASILAAAGFIIAKSPNAKSLIDKVTPFQGIIGVVVLVWGLRDVIFTLGHLTSLGKISDHWVFTVLDWYAVVLVELGLGFLLGMPQIAKWIPGESAAEVKAMEMQKKLAVYQTILGLVGLVVAVLRIILMIKHKMHGHWYDMP